MNAAFKLANKMAQQICNMPPVGYEQAMRTIDAHRPSPAVVRSAMAKPNAPIDPACLKGLYEVDFTTAGKLVLNCFVRYEAGFDGSEDEPPFAAEITVRFALLNGVDVVSMLTEEEISEVEDLALASMLSDKHNNEADVAADRYADMEAA